MRNITLILILTLLFYNSKNSFAQIYDPEGLNIPGSWDNWDNPPTNAVLLSFSQSGGNVRLIPNLNIYQTKFSVPSDISAGTYEFLFTSGPSSDYWQNKWTNANFTVNVITNLTLNGTDNNTITLSDNKYYIINWENIGYENTRAIFTELNTAPVSITSVTQDITDPAPLQDITVTVTTDNSPSENVYLRYTTDNWTTSSVIPCTFSGTSGTAVIPGQAEGTEIKYNIFTTVISNPTSDFNLITINFDNNNGNDYVCNIASSLTCEDAGGVLSTTPVFPLPETPVTIIFDATQGNAELEGYSGNIYAHTGVITSESSGNNDWRYIVSEWGENLPELKFERDASNSNIYTLTIDNIRDFYGVPDNEEIYKIAMVIRSEDPISQDNPDDFYVARNADGSDFHLDIYNQELNVKYLGSLDNNPLVNSNTQIPICIYGLNSSVIKLNIDGAEVAQTNNSDLMYALNTGDYGTGTHLIIANASDGSDNAYDTTYFYIRDDVTIEDLPSGMHNGINYIDDNTVTLVLPDPPATKNFAFVTGDFNNWKISDEGYMKKTPDGKYFWQTITGLNPNKEYAYQYNIDGELKIADPFCDKILDPWNDSYIPETTYSDLKPYPQDKTSGIVSIFETAQTPYNWQIENFTPQAVNGTQSNLIIYELLIRDFVKSKAVKNIIDTLDYLQKLGINAVELLPIAEFDGNDSWGYAPSFYFAPDKAYGTKNDYKAFIDACHERGIAVILDVVYNHMFGSSPLVQMYWDKDNNIPAADNPWFNQYSPHPFGIGYDLNHESPYTKELVKDNLNYWLTEYKVDGFRFDLSKGFTNTYTGSDVSAWNNYDQSRIDIISDYYNFIKSVNPNAYVILEHLADNDEEKVLANSGCLLWGVEGEPFNQATMGYDTNSDFSYAFYGDVNQGGRGWAYPNLIPFMESHDEERIMYNNITYGNGFVNDTVTALKRTEAAAAMYMTVPGPKMIWQFGEFGYDESIELCPDQTYSEDCRTSDKPLHWEYLGNYERQKLYWTYAAMAKLKTENNVFINGTYTQDLGGYGKRMWISGSDMNISVSANFGTSGFDMAPGFQHTGTWYNYFTGESISVSDASGHTLFYNPGDFNVFTDVQLTKPFTDLIFCVKSYSGSNITGATVTIEGYTSQKTNSSGEASFISETNTDLNYTVSAQGFAPQSGSITIGTESKTEYIILQSNTDVFVNQKTDISIFPNPAENFITVKTNKPYKFKFSDITGKEIISGEIKNTYNTLNVSQIKPGIYTLTLFNQNTVKTKKIIIKK